MGNWTSLLREFGVDFIGIMLPGFAFAVALVPTILLPGFFLLETVGTQSTADELWLTFFSGLISTFRLEIFITVIAFSYIIGHLFYRQDPKVPDTESFWKVLDPEKDDGAVRVTNNPNPSVEFPYSHIKEYLADRGMSHLAERISWPTIDADSVKDEHVARHSKKRTKNFINLMKIRIEYVAPEKYGRISRNEAHIRLMSSAWYASISVMLLAIVGLLTGILVNAIAAKISHVQEIARLWPVPYPATVLIPGTTFVGALLIKNGVEKFLHYQRVREIVYVLETFHMAVHDHPHIAEHLPMQS